jgi:phosphate transport system substrate-binding protein
MKTLKFIQIFLFVTFVSTFVLKAQSQRDYITISGTRFTYPLIEKWISEYKKVNPQARIKIQNSKLANDSVNLKVIAHTLAPSEIKANELYFQVSRYALLPITNERNLPFKKEFKKGLKQEDFKKVFFADPNSAFEEEAKNQPVVTVYTRANQTCSSIAFANHFGLKVNEIKGKKISGEDQYLTLAVQKDTTGVSFNNLGYIFDINTRVPVKGINVIAIDLNGNGKIDKEELIYDNLDVLTQYLENNQDNKAIPTDYVTFIVNKNQKSETLHNFISWVLTDGQKYNHTYGFLNNNNTSGNLSQNLSGLQ